MVSPAEGWAGSLVTVQGGGFADGCNDAGMGAVDRMCNPWPPDPQPLRGVRIDFLQDGKRQTLATVDGYGFEIEVRIPRDASPGNASFVTDFTGWAEFTVAPGPAVVPEPLQPPSIPVPLGNRLVAADAGVFTLGERSFHGSGVDWSLPAPVVGMATTPTGAGYWLAAADGGVFSFGDALFYGSDHAVGGCRVPDVGEVVDIAAHPDGIGYWTVSSQGFVFGFGSAGYFDSLFPWNDDPAVVLHAPIVAMMPTADGYGYWLVAADGGVFAFGDAMFHGSATSLALQAPIVDAAATPSGDGYWLVAADGGVFAFGDAAFHGSAATVALQAPIVAMAPTADGTGYVLAGADGGVLTFGSAPFLGSLANEHLNGTIIDIGR